MDLLSVVVGAVIGIVLTSIVWSLIIVNSKKQQEKIKTQRDHTISSIAEILIETDALVTSNQSGQQKHSSLKTSLLPKLTEINKILKLSMHNLDVYYVKYIENVLDQYNKLLSGAPAVSVPVVTETPETKPEETSEFVVEKITNENEVTMEEPVTKDQIKVDSEPVISQKTPVDVIPFNKPESITEPENISKPVLPEFVNIKKEIIEKIPEEKVKNKISDKELLINNFEKEFEEASNFEQTDTNSALKVAPEEEFALETLMDFDMSNINKIHQKERHSETETKKIILKPPVKTSPDSSQPIVSKEEIPATMDEQEVDFDTFFEIQSNSNDPEKKDVNITGDDIADQIDSFFNIK